MSTQLVRQNVWHPPIARAIVQTTFLGMHTLSDHRAEVNHGHSWKLFKKKTKRFIKMCRLFACSNRLNCLTDAKEFVRQRGELERLL